jgi:serine protease Do
MKRTAVVAALAALCISASVYADASSLLADAAKKTDGTMAVISYKIQGQNMGGVAVCIDPSGVFLTFSIEPGMRMAATPAGATTAPATTAGIENLEIIVPGPEPERFQGELVSTDPETGIAFVRDITRKRKWSAVEFAETSELKTGMPVASAGLMWGDPALTKYYGLGYVSAEVRTPVRMVYVTGGSLTGACSPVLNESGKAIGLVVPQQPFLSYQVAAQQGQGEIRLLGRQERQFFMPVEEFAHVLKNRDKQRTLPWMGVLELRGADSGVAVGRVLPGQVADRAGLKDGDVILALNGKPVEKLATPEMTGEAFARRLIRLDPGDKISLTVKTRDGEKWTEKAIELTLEPQPMSAAQAPRTISIPAGVLVRDKVLLDRYFLPGRSATTPGVVVAGVIQGSLAESLQAGDLINSVNGEPIANVQEFARAVDAAVAGGKPISLIVWRGDNQLPVLNIPARPAPPATAPTTAPAGRP